MEFLIGALRVIADFVTGIAHAAISKYHDKS
jgi:hypothetical protein